MEARLIAEFKARLLEERAELQELREMASTDRKPVELDQASVAASVFVGVVAYLASDAVQVSAVTSVCTRPMAAEIGWKAEAAPAST
jgi:hypothetical protein